MPNPTRTILSKTGIAVNGPDVLDAWRWRPTQAKQAVIDLAEIAMTVDEPDELQAQVKTLPDGRTQVIYLAYVRPTDFNGEGDDVGPYLMMIYEPESGAQVWLRRTDVILCDA